MAETKTDLLKKAKDLGIEHMTSKNTMAELREAIAAVDSDKHDKEANATEVKEAPVAKSGKRSAKAIAEKEAEVAKEERKASTDETAAPKTTVKPTRTRLERAGKKLRAAAEIIDKTKEYTTLEALDMLAKTSTTKFDATVELHMNLAVDPKHADQNIRDNLVLPHGTGRTIRVAVFADADQHESAKKAGADVVGAEDFLAQLDKELINFDILVATPATMPKLGKYARLLGPKGLMPNPKSGTVTTDVEKAVSQAKAGRVEYRVDGAGIVHLGVGKVSFGTDKLSDNLKAVFASIKAAKPASVKGSYVKGIYLTTTMGPSIKVSANEL